MISKVTMQVSLIAFLFALTSCSGKIFDSGESEQRGFSDSILRILDFIYPKDDSDSKIMKEIFTLLVEDGPPSLESGIDALDYLLK
ncbi:unnamed protein product [Leptosia nina]|uniref:Lipoprotein n=1 Tax=Leptosia nina TaxID=320188 RepID=A0AAV1JWH7_9NEOP